MPTSTCYPSLSRYFLRRSETIELQASQAPPGSNNNAARTDTPSCVRQAVPPRCWVGSPMAR